MKQLIKLHGIISEDFINYKKPSMVLEFPFCSLKCGEVCQNSPLLKETPSDYDVDLIITNYINNPITEAVVMQGMEPFDSFNEMLIFIQLLRIREKNNDDIVIYTGYNADEIADKTTTLKKYKNIIVKFGRFIPNQKLHEDYILGVKLASDNQYAERIS